MQRASLHRWVILAGLGLAPAGCMPPQGTEIQGIYTDQFSTFVEVDGETRTIDDFSGPWVEWSLTSLVDKKTRAVTYRIDFDYIGPPGSPRFVFAADDTARSLQVVRFAHGRYCDVKPCSTEDEAGVVLDNDTLLGRLTTGYQVKVSARDGEAYVLTIAPDMIAKQLAAVNQVLNSPAVAPAPPAEGLTLGVYALPVPPNHPAVLRDPNLRGMQVLGVQPGLPAARAGLAVGDVITDYDGRPVTTPAEMAAAVAAAGTGRTVPVGVVRWAGGGRVVIPVAM